jgi:hypothetical protein
MYVQFQKLLWLCRLIFAVFLREFLLVSTSGCLDRGSLPYYREERSGPQDEVGCRPFKRVCCPS